MNVPSGATSSKLLVPRVPVDLVARPRLDARLAGITSARLTTVVAGTGFGKSTLVARWAAEHPTAWYTVDRTDRDPRVLAAGLTMALRVRMPSIVVDPAALSGGSPADDSLATGFAAHLASWLADHLRSDVTLVVDDAHELDGSASAPLLAALCRHAPPALHLVLLSQDEVPFPIARLRAQAQVLELTASELAFGPDETAAVVTAALPDAGSGELATLVHRATAGWPAAVRMATAALAGRPPAHRRTAIERLSRPGSPVAELLAEEVFGALASDETVLVGEAARLDRFSVELLDAMGLSATRTVPRLARAGVVVQEEAEPGWYAVPPLVRAFVEGRRPPGEISSESAERTSRAAAWLEHRGAHREALTLLLGIGDSAATAAYISRHARALVSAGAAGVVLRAVESLLAEARAEVVGPEIEARFAAGDWDGVAAAVDRFPTGGLPPIVALRAGMVLHLRGRIHDGLDIYSRGLDHADGDTAAVAAILAYRSAANWLLGDAAACRADATRAMTLASSAADDAALAAAHTVAAMIAAVDGDRAANEAHYVRALAHAEAAGDVLQIIRIRTNRGSRAIEEGAHAEGLTELDLAIDLAERSGYQSSAALALSNRGEAHLRLGRVDESARDLEAAVARYSLLGSRLRAYPLTHLGELHQLRDERVQARAAYTEALRLSEEAADVQGLAPCLAGLAELLVDDDLDDAAKFADRALAIEPSLSRARALWAAGLVAVRRGDGPAVERLADELALLGRERRDRAASAFGLELRGMVADPDGARAARREARQLWRNLGEPACEARAGVALAAGGDGADGVDAAGLLDAADDVVRRLGARSLSAPIDEARRRLARIEASPVRISTLGGFRVYRNGDAIPSTGWQSRKARDLLKLLTTRMGRPLPREQVCETLWPDEPADKRSSRLSVTLSTLRGVLDPERGRDADAFVAADRDHVWIDLSAVDLDVARFIDGARRVLVASDPSIDELAAAEARYAGEYLDDEPYSDWAVGLREEARSLYLQVAQRLADTLRTAGRLEHAGHLYLRLLQRDPYDEAAHLALVRVLDAAGHRGEARRAYRTYSSRMAELDVEPAAYPSP